MLQNLKTIIIFVFLLLAVFLASSSAYAHVVVSPKEVGIGKAVKFTVDVPSELENKSTVSVRLVLPYTMTIGRFLKPGWNVELKRTPASPENQGTEIIWSGGTIPSKFREEFEFFTQAPPKETKMIWKAYQTYDDGSVVAWDLDPKAEQPKDDRGNIDTSEFGPYSETNVINDLSEKPASGAADVTKINNTFLLSVAAIVLAAMSLGLQIYRR